MQLINLDLRRVRTGVKLSRAEIIEGQYEALCARTERRQRAAKAALAKQGVEPRIRIGSGWVPSYIARHFLHVKVA